MERSTSLLSLSSRSSSNSSTSRNNEPLLPYAEPASEKQPSKRLASSSLCLYRRVLLWTVFSLILVSVALFKATDYSVTSVAALPNAPKLTPTTAQPGIETASVGGKNNESQDKGLTKVNDKNSQEKEGQHGDDKHSDNGGAEDKLSAEEDKTLRENAEEDLKKMPWLRFPHLNGYFHGLKALVQKNDHIPEYPNTAHQAPFGQPPLHKEIPKPEPYSPYPADDLRKACFLDAGNTTEPPRLYAYNGIPQYMPDPSFGSYDLFGLRDDVCFDRFGRYGPYGFGYEISDGGVGVGLDSEDSGSDAVWETTGKVNYTMIDWREVQDRCSAANKHRFAEPDPDTEDLRVSEDKKGRIAVVVRLYTDYVWTQLALLNLRALVSELSLRSGGEYEVHLLLHVRDNDAPIWSDDETVEKILQANVPHEFHGMVTMWSEAQMKLLYPGKFDEPLSNPSRADIHGVYRSAHLPLQIFAQQHPEYEHFWNWEMDMRFLGNYYELFDRLGRWAGKQPRKLLWEQSSRYYIPSYHGSWENFTKTVEQDTIEVAEEPVFGSLQYPGNKPLRFEQRGETALPESCDDGRDMAKCGVDEPADIITLNPIFKVDGSGWVFSNDVTGYEKNPSPPRRCSIITASRLSRRLLTAMHEEVWRHHQSMFSEMFPPTVALHHGFKAVYAPHPVYMERAWDPQGSAIQKAFNGGHAHSTSGGGSPFHLHNEHNHKGTTWYYNSEFAGLLWRRWLGFAQTDGRVPIGSRANKGKLRGGKVEESSEDGSGRMCLRSMLLHPIKWENPADKPAGKS